MAVSGLASCEEARISYLRRSLMNVNREANRNRSPVTPALPAQSVNDNRHDSNKSETEGGLLIANTTQGLTAVA
ncbi:hypothetical protein AVEN_135806-1 [Araneus ventricosus]|uniref:Uncharacterized protein n=1 Tax=Araneus ventricosus TaxID=182803 RepID=A0A4Y2UGH3_ARAVE|nr:hypothetical protein AVEN_135806-1 [Araneus ventricosus]